MTWHQLGITYASLERLVQAHWVHSLSNCVGIIHHGASQVALAVKNPPVNAGDIRDAGSIPGPERSPAAGNDNLRECSCLENPMDREA